MTSAMETEIRQFPQLVREKAGIWLEQALDALAQLGGPRPLIVIGRGSSGHVCTFLTYIYSQKTGYHPLDFRPWVADLDCPRVDYSPYWVCAFSASGESTDVAKAVRWLGERGARCLAVTNSSEPDCLLGHASQFMLRLDMGPELAVPATKSFCAQIIAAAILAGVDISSDLDDAVARFHAVVESAQAHELSAWINGARTVVWLGRGANLAAASDAALKLQESTGQPALAYSTAEFFHGPLGAVGPEDRVVIFDDDCSTELVERLSQSLDQRQVAYRRIRTVHLDGKEQPSSASWVQTVEFSLLGQCVALYHAYDLGLNPDQPLSLKKVTQT